MNSYHRRLATFEGPAVLSVDMPLKGNFPRRAILDKTELIVRHIQLAAKDHPAVAQIQLYFKIDSKDRVWMLFCSTLRLFRSNPSLVLSVDPVPEYQLRLGVP
eukprot:SAG31_NODE_16501_length_707_cov_0.593750_2_plen_102_part_01